MCKSLKLCGNEIFAVCGSQEYSLAGLMRLSAKIGPQRKKLHKNFINAKKRVLTNASLMSETSGNTAANYNNAKTVYKNE